MWLRSVAKHGMLGAVAAVSALANETRRAAYALVAASPEPVGREAVARALGIPRSVAAYHLDRLVVAGLLEAYYRRPPGRSGPGAGRPPKLYRRGSGELSVTVPVRAYDVAARLLAEAAAGDGTGAAARRLVRAARAFGRRIGREAGEVDGRGAPERLLGLLEERGYEPALVGTAIRLRNCPFRALAGEYRDLICSMNLALVDGAARAAAAGGAAVRHDEAAPEAGSCCVVVRLGPEVASP